MRRAAILLTTLTLASSVHAQSAPVQEHTTAPWVVAGIGIATALVSTAFLLGGTNDISDAHKQCPNGVCNATVASYAADEDQKGKTLVLTSAILYSVGGAAVIGGLLWHFLEPTGKPTHAWIIPSIGGATFVF
jgi:hypothetical protein